MIRESLTLVGILLSLVVLSMFVFLLLFEHGRLDSPLVIGIIITGILFADVFQRIRIILGRMYKGGTWKKARRLAGFGTLYLIFPLVWTFSKRFGYATLNQYELIDKNILLGTIGFNLFVSFI